MVDVTASGCINHPGVEATARCKQCGKPVCGACTVHGPTGKFCSEVCKEKHEGFMQRAQQMQQGSRRTGDIAKLKRLLIKLVIWIVALVAVGFGAIYFQIPVLSNIAWKVYQFIAAYLPFI